jgi:hypothetical protein
MRLFVLNLQVRQLWLGGQGKLEDTIFLFVFLYMRQIWPGGQGRLEVMVKKAKIYAAAASL